MTSTQDTFFVWIARDSTAPSIMTMSDPAVLTDLDKASKGIALAAAAPAAMPRKSRRSVGLFIAVSTCASIEAESTVLPAGPVWGDGLAGIAPHLRCRCQFLGPLLRLTCRIGRYRSRAP